ncbi:MULTISPECIES: DUF1992 domain-containing protein [unclassified Meridianimarinicoccus]|uniref:DnaJ family domain-containing protein n=1 Tax=unclassified Meridianimarinicoccus TaxID=2923344 RepID=UPI0018692100|nr:DUF1992 domain-containing protein [Fluviibacterium sp. MJW13]
MIRSLATLTESRIRRAEAEGQFSDLSGAGKPLPYRPGDALIDAGTAVGHRLMAEAGALPEEIRLKQALDQALTELANAAPEDRKTAMSKVADLQLKHAIAQEARRKFLK